LGLSVIFFLLTVIFFVVGAFATKLVCQTLKEPKDSDLVSILTSKFQYFLVGIFLETRNNFHAFPVS
jgi:hypothetical protein